MRWEACLSLSTRSAHIALSLISCSWAAPLPLHGGWIFWMLLLFLFFCWFVTFECCRKARCSSSVLLTAEAPQFCGKLHLQSCCCCSKWSKLFTDQTGRLDDHYSFNCPSKLSLPPVKSGLVWSLVSEDAKTAPSASIPQQMSLIWS